MMVAPVRAKISFKMKYRVCTPVKIQRNMIVSCRFLECKRKCDAIPKGRKSNEKVGNNDPCAPQPCKNGATCLAKVQKEKATYECYCAIGYGGPHCDQRPCDVNPCLHNGTCRTTAGYSSYFCDCQPGYGGKNCDIAIGSKLPEERYGSNVLLVSSGKAEWIQEMKERLGGQKKTPPPSIADEPYKGTKKPGREEREKQDAARHDEKGDKSSAGHGQNENHETPESSGYKDVKQPNDMKESQNSPEMPQKS
ncbi:KU protein, partial [Parelaphostrongylus tenuis]